jgi:hypothetical protein
MSGTLARFRGTLAEDWADHGSSGWLRVALLLAIACSVWGKMLACFALLEWTPAVPKINFVVLPIQRMVFRGV